MLPVFSKFPGNFGKFYKLSVKSTKVFHVWFLNFPCFIKEISRNFLKVPVKLRGNFDQGGYDKYAATRRYRQLMIQKFVQF